jgi:Fur family peroxide stress response transcriptional regulator
MDISEIRNRLVEKGLKITPQRIAILEAIIKLNNHPTADNIIYYVRQNHPNIATATVYKVLDALEEKELINKVNTDRDIMRYDAIMEKHHHLYSTGSDRIVDYFDKELNELIDNYFKKNSIPDFEIEDIKLQVIGKFKSKDTK